MSGYIYIRYHDSYDLPAGKVYKIGYTNNIEQRNRAYITCEPDAGRFIAIYQVDDARSWELRIKRENRDLNYKSNGGTEFYAEPIVEKVEQMLRGRRVVSPKYSPRAYQLEIIDTTVSYLSTNDKCVLSLACGTGKTLLGLFIAERLNAKTVIVGVPNLELKKQWRDVAKHFAMDVTVITYHVACLYVDKQYDVVINDEVHHLTQENADYSDRSFVRMLDIQAKKRISLSATPKYIENAHISNDEAHFGKTIVNYDTRWAIENHIICDYRIYTMPGRDKFETSAKLAVYAIKEKLAHHIFIYANDIKNAKTVTAHLKHMAPTVYSRTYTSESKNKNIIDEFVRADVGVIVCVYCLNEGFDCPRLDAVVFAEMMQSPIRITQSALRACRKNADEPNKIAKILLPDVAYERMFDVIDASVHKKIRIKPKPNFVNMILLAIIGFILALYFNTFIKNIFMNSDFISLV